MKFTKLLLAYCLSIVFLTSIGIDGLGQTGSSFGSNQVIKKGERPPIDLKKVSSDAFEKGQIRIKIKETYSGSIDPFQLPIDGQGHAVFNIGSIDRVNERISVNEIKPLFALLGKQQQSFNTKHKDWGFDRWYLLKVDENTDILKAVEAFNQLKEIEIAEPVYKKHRIIGLEKQVLKNTRPSDAGQGRNWTPDDEYFALQWHYNNTGQEAGTPDADIDLPEAWDLSTGNANVIVAIVDGGIDYNHVDIAPNMWEGIGYNFVYDTPEVTTDDHGTHVAGTVAAATGNATGVAGIAGGSGTGNGVRLMSAQVFSGDNGGGFHLAPIWAADNGACISQNSWGYNSPGSYNQAELDAIDYFNQNGGGGALLGGGITIFAAGNDNSSLDYYPGYYSGTLSVAATNNQDIRSYYSNYGDWVDISAPGGETTVTSNRGVLSTLPGNSYGFYQGTSMACPHVSGSAALIASLAYGQLTNAEVWNILVSSTDNIEAENPSLIGQMGSGRLNAYSALVETQAYMGGLLNPANFMATPQSAHNIDLTWELNQDNNDVLLITSLDGNFIAPMEGESFQQGDILSEGQEVLFVGNAIAFNHVNLDASTTYYYKLWSVDNNLAYSPGITSAATTFCDIQTLPFVESFESANWPACWTQTIDGASGTPAWIVNASATAGGAANEMRARWQNGIGTARLISPLLDLSGSDTNFLQFKYYYDDYRSGCQIKIQSSNDGANWIDQPFLFESGHGNYGPKEVTVPLINTSDETYIAWVIEGDQYQFDYWYVDDVMVQSEQPASTYYVSLTANPEDGGTLSGAGLYTFGENVSISAIPAADYFFIEWQDIDGNPVTNANPYVFQMPEEDYALTAHFNHCSGYPVPFNLSASQVQSTYSALLAWEKPAIEPGFPEIASTDVYLDGNLMVNTTETEYYTGSIGYGTHEFCVVFIYTDGGRSCYGTSCFAFDLVNESTVNGSVYDILTAEPIPNATVLMTNSEASYYFFTNEIGFYTGEVLSGTYNFTIAANGFIDLNVPSIEIAEASVSTNDFELTEFPYPVGSVVLSEPSPGIALIEWPLADPGWLHYDDGVNVDGVGGPETFSWAIKFDPNQLLDYEGFSLEKVALFTRTTDPIEISICEGPNASVVLHQETIVPQAANNWESYDLSSTVPIDTGQELWVVCYTAHGTVYPAAYGENQNEPNGDLVSLDGTTWEHIADYSLNFTWNLQAYVSNVTKNEPIELKRRKNNRHFQADASLLSKSNLPQKNSTAFNSYLANDTRALNGYSVYRSSCYTEEPVWIATTIDRFYYDNEWANLPYGAYRYGVVAEYDLNQSEIIYSNCMDKDMLTTVNVQVSTNSGDSPAGTLVRFMNLSEPELGLVYEYWLDEAGHLEISDFRKGTYNLLLDLDGFSAISLEEVVIDSEIEFNYVLMEVLFPTESLFVTPLGKASWMGGNSLKNSSDKSLQNYKVWLDGVFVADTPNNFWQHDVSDLVDGQEYLTEVAAVYTTGTSTLESYYWTYYGCEYFQEPQNLEAIKMENSSNVQLQWENQPGRIKLTQYPGAPANGYYQQFGYGYGVAYDLSAYPDALVNAIDFHHASWGTTGTWEYNIHIYDWDAKALIATLGPYYTTGDDIWEMDVELGNISTGGATIVAILVEPLGNVSTDAYPDLSSDNASDPQGSIYGPLSDVNSIGSSTIGNFLMDLYIYSANRSVLATPVNFNHSQAPLAKSKSNAFFNNGTLSERNRNIIANSLINISENAETTGTVNRIAGASKSLAANRALLYDNGPLVNSAGTAADGADESILQNSSMGMTTLGSAIQFAMGNHMADDFVVDATWNIDAFTFYGYQTNSGNTSTMTGGYLRIFDGNPSTGGTLIWGDMTTNRMTSTQFSNIYRISETTGGIERPVMEIVCETPGLVLEPGTYWVEYAFEGSETSGPWAPPITITGQTTTGNAMQFLGDGTGWVQLNDGGTITPQGLPFLINGTSNGANPDPVIGVNIYRDGAMIAEMFNGNTFIDYGVEEGNHSYCVQNVYASGGESCLDAACTNVLVTELCDAPTNLNASYNEDTHQVDLSWETNVVEEWLYYDDGTKVDGIGGPATFTWAIKFDPEQLVDFNGASLTKIQIYNILAEADELHIYEGTNAETLLLTQMLSDLPVEAWAEVDLTSPVPINVNKELWIAVYTDQGVNYPAACGPTQNAPNGDLITLDGTLWEHLSDYALPYTWNLRGLVTTLSGQTKALNPIEKPIAYNSAGQQNLLSISNEGAVINNKLDIHQQRALVYYQIYRNVNGGNYQPIAEVPYIENEVSYSFADNDLGNSEETYCYYVTANYEYCGESAPSNEACTTLPSACSPGWTPVPNQQYNMQVLGQIQLDNAISLNPNDVVGAFVGEECRGIASPIPDFNGLFFLSIGSDQTAGEAVTLKIWNSVTCVECEAVPTIVFENMAEIGTIDEPVTVSCNMNVELNLSFGQGYTWFSENLSPEEAHPNNMFVDLSPCNNDRLIAQSSFSVYYEGSWNGTIDAMSPMVSYRMKLCEAQEVSIIAAPIEISPIVLNNGYTWLGYLPQACLPINEALANLDPLPSPNDRLIGQNSFAIYTGSTWIGSLTTLCPGNGYVIKLANSSTLTYPEAAVKTSSAKTNQSHLYSPIGDYPASYLQHSMTILGQIKLHSGQFSNNPNDRVYAYINGLCVGMANPNDVEAGLVFMNVGENNDETQEVSFRVWLDEQQRLYEVVDTILFVPLKGAGTLNMPFKFTLGRAVDDNNLFIGTAYPNPFNDETVIPISLPYAATLSIELHNSLGQLVFAETIHATAGSQHYQLVNRGFGAGLYQLTILVTSDQSTKQDVQKLSIR